MRPRLLLAAFAIASLLSLGLSSLACAQTRGDPDDGEAATVIRDEGADRADDPVESEDTREHRPSTANIVGHATSFMIAGLTLISGVITGITTVSLHSDLSDRCGDMVPCTDPNGPADRQRMRNLALATDILLGTSLVAATVGLIIALLGRAGDDEASPVACGADGCRFEARF